MSTAAVVLSFLGGSAVGAIGAAGITARHSSTERLRAHLEDAALNLLAMLDLARDTIWRKIAADAEFLESKNAAVGAGEDARDALSAVLEGWQRTGLEPPPQPEPFTRAIEAIIRLADAADGLHNPLNTAQHQEAADTLAEARLAMRDVLSVKASEEVMALIPILRLTIRAQTRFVEATRAAGEANASLVEPISNLHAAVARVRLVFPLSDDVSETTRRAEAVKQSVLDLLKAVAAAPEQELNGLRDPEITASFQTIHSAADEFAHSANVEIAKSRWPWTK